MAGLRAETGVLLLFAAALGGCAAPPRPEIAAARAAQDGIWWQHLATDGEGREYFMLSSDRRARPETTFDAWLLRRPHIDDAQLRRQHYVIRDPGEGLRWRFDCRARRLQRLAEGRTLAHGFEVIRVIDDEARAVAPASFEEALLLEACRGAGVEARTFD